MTWGLGASSSTYAPLLTPPYTSWVVGSITGRSWRLSAKKARAAAFERQAPACGGLVGVGGPEVGQLRHRAQHHQLLDGLVRGPVLAQPDRIVRKHKDRVCVRQAPPGGPPAWHSPTKQKNVDPYGTRPPCAAIPFTAAHMPNSRTPKNTLRPAGSSCKLRARLEDRLR